MTPYKKAWDEFIASKQGDELVKGLTNDPPTRYIYAENRLRNAFDAGWNAAQQSKKISKKK